MPKTRMNGVTVVTSTHHRQIDPELRRTQRTIRMNDSEWQLVMQAGDTVWMRETLLREARKRLAKEKAGA